MVITPIVSLCNNIAMLSIAGSHPHELLLMALDHYLFAVGGFVVALVAVRNRKAPAEARIEVENRRLDMSISRHVDRSREDGQLRPSDHDRTKEVLQ